MEIKKHYKSSREVGSEKHNNYILIIHKIFIHEGEAKGSATQYCLGSRP
jgi:hypothetical protein